MGDYARARRAGRARPGSWTCCGSPRAIAGYAARSVGNGLEPEEARRAALEAAADLEAAAAALRRLARPDPVADSAARRAAALELAAAGWPARAIAERLGVNPETARRYAAGILGPVNVKAAPGGAGSTVIPALTEIGPRL